MESFLHWDRPKRGIRVIGGIVEAGWRSAELSVNLLSLNVILCSQTRIQTWQLHPPPTKKNKKFFHHAVFPKSIKMPWLSMRQICPALCVAPLPFSFANVQQACLPFGALSGKINPRIRCVGAGLGLCGAILKRWGNTVWETYCDTCDRQVPSTICKGRVLRQSCCLFQKRQRRRADLVCHWACLLLALSGAGDTKRESMRYGMAA